MIVTVIWASAKVASSALVPGEAVASSIVAIALIIAVRWAFHQRAIKSIEALLARAGHVGSANTIAGAIVRANTRLTLNAGVTSLALTNPIGTEPVIVTIIRTSTHGAVLACPFSLATARTVEANTMPGTIRGAGSQATVYVGVSRVTQALSIDAGSMPRAIIFASL
jgi:hypothetical protein